MQLFIRSERARSSDGQRVRVATSSEVGSRRRGPSGPWSTDPPDRAVGRSADLFRRRVSVNSILGRTHERLAWSLDPISV